MKHIMKLQADSFNKIKDGKKIIEVRLYDEKRRAIKLGDNIEFKKEPEQIESIDTEVIDILQYKSFEDLVSNFPASDFGYESKEDLLASIYSFYKKEDGEKFGVLGIKIKLIK